MHPLFMAILAGSNRFQCSSLPLMILSEGMDSRQVIGGLECCSKRLNGIKGLLYAILDTRLKAQLMPNTGDTIQTKKRIKE
jgi:hypothetical protein